MLKVTREKEESGINIPGILKYRSVRWERKKN
jgi:hypothetical protein